MRKNKKPKTMSFDGFAITVLAFVLGSNVKSMVSSPLVRGYPLAVWCVLGAIPFLTFMGGFVSRKLLDEKFVVLALALNNVYLWILMLFRFVGKRQQR
ncbi:MAG: hypothetical protein WC269_01570 [Candidatus Gracilibacteria bacterium]